MNNDPIQEAGGINLTMGINNNPLNFVDPWGLEDAFDDLELSDARLNAAGKNSALFADLAYGKEEKAAHV